MGERIYILEEESLNKPMWFSQASSGIEGIAMRRKYGVSRIHSVEEIPDTINAIILIGDSKPWFIKQLGKIRARKARPIIIGGIPWEYGDDVSGSIYSIKTAIEQAVLYFHKYGRDNLALIDINERNSIDVQKEEAFIEIGKKYNLPLSQADVYSTDLSSVRSFDSFWKNIAKYNGVICSNDASGILVLQHAKDCGISVPDDLFVCGIGDMSLCRYSSPSLTSITRSYYEAGIQAFHIWRTLQQDDTGLSSIVTINSVQLKPRGSTAFLSFDDDVVKAQSEYINTTMGDYDRRTHRIRDIQNCLSACDMIDLEIILGVLRKESNEYISEKISASPGTVVYRLRKLYKAAHVSSKAEFANLFKDINLELE